MFFTAQPVDAETAEKWGIVNHLTTEEELAPPARDLEAAEALWEKTMALLSQKGVNL